MQKYWLPLALTVLCILFVPVMESSSLGEVTFHYRLFFSAKVPPAQEPILLPVVLLEILFILIVIRAVERSGPGA